MSKKTATITLVLLLLAGAATAADRDTRVIIEALPPLSGARVVIFGAGPAGLLPAISDEVGQAGKVAVVDTDVPAIEAWQKRIENEKLENSRAVLIDDKKPELPFTPDVLLVINVYHQLGNRRMFFRELRKSLRTSTTIVLIDFYRRPMRVGPPLSERVASHDAMREMKKFGFRFLRRKHVLPYQYFLVYGVR